jgi:Transposase DDE domain
LKHHTPQLSDSDVLQQAKQKLMPHLKLKADGYVCTTDQLFDILLGVAASRDTLESLCAHLQTASGANTIRGYLNQQLRAEELPKLERAINRALAQALPPMLRDRPQEVAMDYHDQPYYGKTEQATGLWVRAAAKAGTTRVYRVATAYVIVRGLRLTLAMKFVSAKQSHKSTLKFLFNRLKSLQIKISLLYLDRGFAGVEVIRFLQRLQQAAIIACPIRGKTGGVKALCVGRESYLTEHTFGGSKSGKAKARVAICRTYTTAKRSYRHPKQAQWLVYILIRVEMSPARVRQKYRRRFGIESSYRCSRKVRGWTTAKNAAYRFLLIGLSFFMLNVWIALRWEWTSKARRGGRELQEGHFRLRRFARFISQALEMLYGRVSHIESLTRAKAYP